MGLPVDNIYGDATCMECGKVCDIVEEVDIGMGEFEMWCYCDECKIDTFHPAIGVEI